MAAQCVCMRACVRVCVCVCVCVCMVVGGQLVLAKLAVCPGRIDGSTLMETQLLG